jgi:branched-chain amino acid aminotransferase
MIAYLNGRFMPEEHAMVSVQDRGFLYGDGLFEAIRVYEGEPFLWTDHISRFQHGCKVLRLNCPLTGNEILRVVREIVRRNRLSDGLVRFTLSRGPGPRGYSPKGAENPTFVITAFAAPELPAAYRVIISSVRLLADDPISDFKNLNKLHQIVARSEADSVGANEALLINTKGFVVEGTTTNVFWIKEGVVCTPPVRGILAGTTRAHILRLCKTLNLSTVETNIRADRLAAVDGLFVTSCSAEVMEVSHLDGQRVKRSPIVRRLKSHYRQLLSADEAAEFSETAIHLREYVKSRH